VDRLGTGRRCRQGQGEPQLTQPADTHVGCGAGRGTERSLSFRAVPPSPWRNVVPDPRGESPARKRFRWCPVHTGAHSPGSTPFPGLVIGETPWTCRTCLMMAETIAVSSVI